MSLIKSPNELMDKQLAEKIEREDQENWESFNAMIKDPKTEWTNAEGKELEVTMQAVESLKRKKGRPKSAYPLQSVHINLPVALLEEIKDRADQLNIGYQSYIKIALTKYLKKNDEAS